MKTLVNKHNPEIRITATEITTAHPPVSNEGYVYWIPAINEMYSPIDWSLVEEEPEKQTSEYFKKPDYDKQVVKKLSEELAKIITDQIVEPVDLEKEIKEWITPPNPSIEPKKETISGELHINCIIATARHFYELGRIAQLEQNKALADMHKSPKEKEE